MGGHYSHVEESAAAFFKKRGVGVVIEPRGAGGPDIEALDGALVGEIRHARELERDLPSTFWSAWNGDGSFGGKAQGFHLKDTLPADVEGLSRGARGFVATVLGQLKLAYVEPAGLDEGWLVIEDAERWMSALNEARQWMSTNRLARSCAVSVDEKGVGFVMFHF
jgi:hypothetical protein